MTGSKRIEFETWFARLSGWADHILSRLEKSVVAKLELGNLSFFVSYKISHEGKLKTLNELWLCKYGQMVCSLQSAVFGGAKR